MLPERALTLYQPYGWLLAGGWKTIENRPVGFSHKSFRGDFWIHAGKQPESAKQIRMFEHTWRQAHDLAKQILGADFRFPCFDELTFGAIIGRATITGIVPPRLSLLGRPDPSPVVPWHFPDQYGFKVANAVMLENPVPCRGFQGFWRVPRPVLEQLRKVA